MIIVLKKDEAKEKIEVVKKAFEGRKQVFVHENRVAVQGAKADEIPSEVLNAAEDVITNVPAAVQSSRLLHPEDTIVKTAHTEVGGSGLALMAGPCSVESEEHIHRMARVAKEAGATVLRGGAFKPRTSPYSFQGLGEEGLKYLREAADENGMDVITEVMDDEHVELVGKYTDFFQVGKTKIPVALKRGMSATIDDVLNAAEYIAAGGNNQIILIERGIRTFDNKYTRNTFDVGAVPVLQQLTHYPVIVDPSHAAGVWDLVTPLAQAGVAAGASGLIVEIHDDPEHTFSDGPQALKPDTFKEMARRCEEIHNVVSAWK